MDVAFRHAAWLARTSGRGAHAPFHLPEIAELAEIVGTERVEAGEILMSEGEPSEHVGLIYAGEVELVRDRGDRRIVLQVLGDGDVFGDVPFFCSMAAPFSARARSATTLVRLDGELIWQLLDSRAHVRQRFIFSLASRLERTQRRLLELTAGSLRDQVTTLLIDETDDEVDTLRLSQETIAELLGATRASVNRVLKELERQGRVELGYGAVTVTDRESLAAEVAG